MQEAIFNTEPLIEVSAQMVQELKQQALQSPRGRFRLCLHRSHDDPIQEMVIACVRGTYFRPHRGRSAHTKSYHVITGELSVFLFDDRGTILRRVEMASAGSDKPFLFRLVEREWHMPVPQSEIVVYHEVCRGPFRKDTDVQLAPWSPAEGDPAAAAYVARLLAWNA